MITACVKFQLHTFVESQEQWEERDTGVDIFKFAPFKF